MVVWFSFFFSVNETVSGILFLFTASFFLNDYEGVGVGVHEGVCLGVWCGVVLNGDGNGVLSTDFFCFDSEFVTDLGGGGGAIVFLQVREDMAEDEEPFTPILHGL